MEHGSLQTKPDNLGQNFASGSCRLFASASGVACTSWPAVPGMALRELIANFIITLFGPIWCSSRGDKVGLIKETAPIKEMAPNKEMAPMKEMASIQDKQAIQAIQAPDEELISNPSSS